MKKDNGGVIVEEDDDLVEYDEWDDTPLGTIMLLLAIFAFVFVMCALGVK
jgi:hypothetical protein